MKENPFELSMQRQDLESLNRKNLKLQNKLFLGAAAVMLLIPVICAFKGGFPTRFDLIPYAIPILCIVGILAANDKYEEREEDIFWLDKDIHNATVDMLYRDVQMQSRGER